MKPLIAAIDSWIFLLLIAVAALLRLLAKAAGSKPAAPDEPDQSTFPQPDQNVRPQGTSSDEEQIRKFLEALGQPRSANVPPPVPPRTDVAPRPVAPVRPPRSMIPVPERRPGKSLAERRRELDRRRRAEVSGPGEPKRTYEPAPPLGQPGEAPTFEVGETAAPLPELQRAKMPAQTPAEPAAAIQQDTDVLRLLRTPRGLRQAIILREIFGAPRSLRPLEDLPGTA